MQYSQFDEERDVDVACFMTNKILFLPFSLRRLSYLFFQQLSILLQPCLCLFHPGRLCMYNIPKFGRVVCRVTHTISPSQKELFDVEGVDPEKIVPISSNRFVSQPSTMLISNTPTISKIFQAVSIRSRQCR